MRWQFGLTDLALIDGAVGSGCSRCTADEIESYLAGINDRVDIDGDGEVLPLSDGMLILRWLFGFTGDALVNGAVNQLGCTRCTATGIEQYLAGLS